MVGQGRFIVFEGGEGAGKSTVIREVGQRLEQQGRAWTATREPGAGELGGRIRELLLNGPDMPAKSELFLFLADRANHVQEIIRPALASGQVVLCDRHADSTFVYQAVARGLDPDFVRAANRFAVDGVAPDLVFVLDLPPEVGLARRHDPNRLDSLPLEFHRKVREGFLSVAAGKEKGSYRVIDATLSAAEVLDLVWTELKAWL